MKVNINVYIIYKLFRNCLCSLFLPLFKLFTKLIYKMADAESNEGLNLGLKCDEIVEKLQLLDYETLFTRSKYINIISLI